MSKFLTAHIAQPNHPPKPFTNYLTPAAVYSTENTEVVHRLNLMKDETLRYNNSLEKQFN